MKATANRRGSVQQPDLSVLGPIREIIRLAEEGKRSKSQLQAFVEGRNPFEVSNPLDIDGVITILGADKVVTAQQAYEAFNRAYLADQAVEAISHSIRYTEETLRECAVLNRSGQSDWRMVYALPLSLRQQREVIGVDRESQPCFYNNDWWLGEAEDAWAKSQPEAGYYLIDMKGRFNRTNWNDQNTRIAEMGEQYERADERVFAQALVSIFKTHGERLHSGTYHWGRIEDSDGYRVCVGFFAAGGLHVSFHPSLRRDPLYVCVSRKFQS